MSELLLKIVVTTALKTLYPSLPDNVVDLLPLSSRKLTKRRLNEILARNCPQEHRAFCENVVGEVLSATPGVDWKNNPKLIDPEVLYYYLLGTYERAEKHTDGQEDGAVRAVLRELAQLMVELAKEDPHFPADVAATLLIGQNQSLQNQQQILQNQQQIMAMLSAKEQAKEPPTDPTEREKQARALAEQGKTAEALALLSAPERKDNPDKAQEYADKGDTLIRQHINENQLHIQLLRQQGLNRETIPKIKALYRESVKLAKGYKVSLYVLYDFADFLWPLHGYDEALELCRWLLKWYELEQASEEERGTLHNLLGILCAENNQMEEAEKYYKEALNLYRALAERSPEAYEPYVAMTCNNLGNLLSDCHRMEEAEAYYKEALDLYRALAERSSEAYEPYVARTCFNLAIFELERGNKPESKRLFQEALALYEKFPHLKEKADKTREILKTDF